jgi:hypothetical protein
MGVEDAWKDEKMRLGVGANKEKQEEEKEWKVMR